MANRHTHKKLRKEVRSRMARTGESYQQALQRTLARQTSTQRAVYIPVPDLIATSYFGVPITIAAYEVLSHLRVIVVSGSGGPLGLPLGHASPLAIHTDGVQ